MKVVLQSHGLVHWVYFSVSWAVHIYDTHLRTKHLRVDTCYNKPVKNCPEKNRRLFLGRGFAVIHGVMNISNNKIKDTYWEYFNTLNKIYEETQSFI